MNKQLRDQTYNINKSTKSTNTKVCNLWHCKKTIKKDYTLCYKHYRISLTGKINKCNICQQYKESRTSLCIYCQQNHKIDITELSFGNHKNTHLANQTNSKYELEYSPIWSEGDTNTNSFYVYILKLKGGKFYAGQTRDLRERLSEHRDGQVESTKYLHPRLVWVVEVPTRNHATRLESKLKKTIDKNPRSVRRMITKFQDIVRELDFG